ncbi:MAG: EF-hand domain-containing protein [Litorimonas sp.]
MKHVVLKTALLASGAALLLAAGPKADLNQDGQVTKAEFTQSAESRFYATDTNGDGFLSEEERKAHREAGREDRKDKRFAALDTNGDGLLSKAEMDARGEKRKARKEERRAKVLEKFDTNLDGELSEAERTVMKAEGKAKRAERKADRKDRKTKRAERPKLDANGDGFISLEEHTVATEQLFARMDANGDGVLTKGEGKKRKGKRGKKRGG